MTTGEAQTAQILLTDRPLERVASEIAVAGFFVDERPLRGGAGRADWRLCGGLSRRILSGDLSGKTGEAMLIACGRALAAQRLLLVGLGDRHTYDRMRAGEEMRAALERCLRLRLRHVGLAPLGIAPDDVPRHASVLVRGILDGLSAVAASRSSEGLLPARIELCVPRSEQAGVRRALEAACEKQAQGAVEVLTNGEEAEEG